MDKAIIAHLLSRAAERSQAPGPGAAGEPLDPWQLVIQASPVVQAVMVVLVLMSVLCWFVVGSKFVRISLATQKSRRFLHAFWNRRDGPHWSQQRLEGMYSHLRSFDGSPLAAMFRAGYVELARLTDPDQVSQGNGGIVGGGVDNIERSLKRAQNNELTDLEARLSLLATTGSTAPFIGLFGTVWGIMNSFLAIDAGKSATLDVVAPGIAEALIATAIGLVAAIPAVMAYNYFIRRIRVLESEMEAFGNDYLNIMRRYFLPS